MPARRRSPDTRPAAVAGSHGRGDRGFPVGRIGEPDDAARLITWLLTDEAAWITGQVVDSEGAFRR